MLVLIRGAGDLASGIALRLWRSGLAVVMTDLERPTAIRRTVAFSEAVIHGAARVEDVEARRAEDVPQARALLAEGILPVLADPDCACREALGPDALVDAILAKRNLGTRITDAPVVIGVGPGFTAGQDCHAVVAPPCPTPTSPASSAVLPGNGCCGRRQTACSGASGPSATGSGPAKRRATWGTSPCAAPSTASSGACWRTACRSIRA